MKYYKECFRMGYEAYQKGIHDPRVASRVRPFRTFGISEIEHAKAISWNKGWNTAKKEGEIV